MNSQQPYITIICTVVDKYYNPAYGDDRVCNCGHRYYRHFDLHDDMENIGCKYCLCEEFVEKTQSKNY